MALEVGFWDMATTGAASGPPRPPLPPFTYEAAVLKVRAAEVSPTLSGRPYQSNPISPTLSVRPLLTPFDALTFYDAYI